MKKRFFKNIYAVLGLVGVVFLLLSALLAPWIAPHDPIEQNLLYDLQPPGGEYPLGTDEYGRCTLSRILWGGRVSLLTGILATAVSSVIGMTLGLIAGFSGGVLDRMIMGGTGVFMAFPGLIMSLTMAGILGPSVISVVIALSSVGWMGFARVTRAKVLSEREKEYVLAAQTMGVPGRWIMLRHLFPSVLSSTMVMIGSGVGRNVLSAASLSFLGVGVRPPTAEWGNMLSAGKQFIYQSPWLTIFPGLAILFSVLAFNALGDGLREAVDPQSRQNFLVEKKRRRHRRTDKKQI